VVSGGLYFLLTHTIAYFGQCLGYGRPNRQGRAVAGVAVHVKGPIRALRACHFDIVQTNDSGENIVIEIVLRMID
jgi:hypothetical protein